MVRPLVFTVAKIKLKKRLIRTAGLVLFALLAIGALGLLVKGKFSKINLASLLENEEKMGEALVINEEDIKEQLNKAENQTPQGKIYEERAEPGEGITHLARKALKEYLREKGISLTPEQKIYVEDYLQKKTGDYWLKIGEKISFSGELIKEGVEKAQQLTQEQLQNLTQFAELVPALNY